MMQRPRQLTTRAGEDLRAGAPWEPWLTVPVMRADPARVARHDQGRIGGAP
jgi:hypothetical protein